MRVWRGALVARSEFARGHVDHGRTGRRTGAEGIMSLEEAKRLIERMNTDEAFREKILAAPETAARLRLAAAEGYDDRGGGGWRFGGAG